MRLVLIAAGLGLVRVAARHPAAHPLPAPARLRAGDPRVDRRRALPRARGQARHPVDGRPRDPRRAAHRLLRRAPASPWRPPTVSGLLALYLTVGLGLVGIADDYLKIFKQRSTGVRARTKLLGQAAVALSLRLAVGCSSRTPTGCTPGVARDLVPAQHRDRPAHRAVHAVDLVPRHGDHERGQPHRRARRPGRRRGDDDARRLHAAVGVAVRPELLVRRVRPLLRRPRPARPRDLRRRRPPARRFGFLWWNTAPAEHLHGRHRIAVARRRDRGARDPVAHRAAAADARRPVPHRRALGDRPGGQLQAHRQTHVPHGPAAPPLRDARLAGDPDRRAVLDHPRACSSRSASACSTPSGSAQ